MEHTYECYLIGLLYLPEKTVDKHYDKQKILNMLLIHDIGESQVGDYPPFYDNIDTIKNKESIFNKGLFIQETHDDIADLTAYLELWRIWEKDISDDININIAKEIDRVQMIYKLFELLNDTDIDLPKERIDNFLSAIERGKIMTDQGKRIYEIIITNNPKYKELYKKYLYK